jgi:hypothetical protein
MAFSYAPPTTGRSKRPAYSVILATGDRWHERCPRSLCRRVARLSFFGSAGQAGDERTRSEARVMPARGPGCYGSHLPGISIPRITGARRASR